MTMCAAIKGLERGAKVWLSTRFKTGDLGRSYAGVCEKKEGRNYGECHYTEAWQERMNVNFNSCKTEQNNQSYCVAGGTWYTLHSIRSVSGMA